MDTKIRLLGALLVTAFGGWSAAADPPVRTDLYVPADRLAALIKKLDAEDFKVRVEATEELKRIGLEAEKAVKALREAAAKGASIEADRRIKEILGDVEKSWVRTTSTVLKLVEELPPATARDLLETLAKGDPESRLTRETKMMLERMTKRGTGGKP